MLAAWKAGAVPDPMLRHKELAHPRRALVRTGGVR
jgi:hypothetical protein